MAIIKVGALRRRLGMMQSGAGWPGNSGGQTDRVDIDVILNCNYNITDEGRVGRTKAIGQSCSHGLDFADLYESFFEGSVIVPARLNRRIAVCRHRSGTILVVFVTLGTEGLSIVSMRPASRKERRLIDG
jgi:uncharacterized DUF497 family protein